MTYFVFADTHGCLSALLLALEKEGYDRDNPNHHLLFLGDAFDKDKEDYEMYLFLKENIASKKLTWVLGNHDIYLYNCLQKKEVNAFSKTTIHNIAVGIDPDTNNEIDTLLEAGTDSLLEQGIYYYETPHYVFTHGMIPFDKKEYRYDSNWRDASNKSWIRFQNSNGMKYVLDGIYVPNKTLVVGHIGSYYGNLTLRHPELVRDSDEFIKMGNKVKSRARDYLDYFDIYYGEHVIGIDCRCFDTGIVHILKIED